MRGFLVKTLDRYLYPELKSLDFLFFRSLVLSGLLGLVLIFVGKNPTIITDVFDIYMEFFKSGIWKKIIFGLFVGFAIFTLSECTRTDIILFLSILLTILTFPLLLLAIFLGICYYSIPLLLFCIIKLHPSKSEILNELGEHLRLLNEQARNENQRHNSRINNFKNTHKLIQSKYPAYNELEQWVEENVSSSSAIKKIFYRYSSKTKNEYDFCMYYWANFLPLKKLNDNDKLELLKTIKIPPLFSRLSTPINVSILYENYTPKQIKLLFNSSFKGMNYTKTIIKYLNTCGEHPLPIFNNMQDLIDYMDALLLANGKFEFNVPKVDLSKLDNSIQRIKTAGELYKYAQEFSNCAKTYIAEVDASNLTFYIAHRDRPIMFHVDKQLYLEEAVYKANKELSSTDLKFIKNLISKAKKL